jgi:uncharacterized protein YkvS
MFPIDDIENSLKSKEYKDFMQFIKFAKTKELLELDYKTGYNMLHKCVQYNSVYELKYMLDNFPDLDLNMKTRTLSPKNILELAVFFERVEIISLILGSTNKISETTLNKIEKTYKKNPKIIEILNKQKPKFTM